MRAPAYKTHSSGEFHYVYGEVYAPLQVDTDGETMTAEDIQKMAHDFIASGKIDSIDREHNNVLCDDVEIVESFVARKNDPDYAEGAWVLGLRMTDGPSWQAIKSGEVNGFSVEALVSRKRQTVIVEYPKFHSGMTESSLEEDDMPSHEHTLYVEFHESDGKVKFGVTDEVLGHVHKISRSVVTDKAAGHSHRFFLG